MDSTLLASLRSHRVLCQHGKHISGRVLLDDALQEIVCYSLSSCGCPALDRELA